MQPTTVEIVRRWREAPRFDGFPADLRAYARFEYGADAETFLQAIARAGRAAPAATGRTSRVHAALAQFAETVARLVSRPETAR